MPAARGVKRTASKASGSAPPKIKKKHGVQLEVPAASKVKGRLLTCGQGDVGQLGLGEDVLETSRFKVVSGLGERIVDACAGGMHTVALDADGKVWTFGCNDEGALGRQGEEFSVGAVALPEPAVAISAGDSHSAALLRNGDVYLWGSFRDVHGSMGLVCEGREGKSCREPIRYAVPEAAAAIASGGDHLLILTVSGAVYSAGCGEQGQLGRLSKRSADRNARQGLSALLVPAQVTLRAAMRSVWAGSHASLALDANSPRVLAWGLNNFNQLGVTGGKKKEEALYTPLEADAFTAVANGGEVDSFTQVSCGQHHSLVLDNKGTCYAVGRCDYGRLGLGAGSGDAKALTPVPALQEKKCVSVAAGTSSSYAVTDNGEVYAWGMGSEGQLGTGDEEDQPAPRRVTAPELLAHKPLKVSAGGQHTVLFVANTADGTDVPAPAAAATSGEQKADGKPPAARGRGKAQRAPAADAQVSSSAAEPMEVDAPDKPKKQLNGENEEAMDTDEAEIPEEKSSDKKETQDKLAAEKMPKLETKDPVKESPKEEPSKEEPAKEEPAKEEPAKDEPAKEEPAKEKPTKEETRKEVKATVAVDSKSEITNPQDTTENKSVATPQNEDKPSVEVSKPEVTPEPKPEKISSEEPKLDSGISSEPKQESKVTTVEVAEDKTVNGNGEAEKADIVAEKSKAIVTDGEAKSATTAVSGAVAL